MAKSKKAKRATAVYDIKEKKRPRAVEPVESSIAKKPSWKFSVFDCDGLDCLSVVTAQIFWDTIYPRLRECESMTWAEVDKGEHNHYLNWDTLIRKAQKRLEEIAQDDIEALYQLGFTGCQRLIGIRDQETFKLIWWDPEHQVCPAPKKHS